MKTILVDAVYCFVSPDGKIHQDMFNLLETYPNRKILLTGANDEQFNKFGLDKMPYEVFTLRHNPEKTNTEYFRKMLAHYDLTKDDVFYFEHNHDAAESAKSIGIVTFCYDNNKNNLVELKVFLDKNL